MVEVCASKQITHANLKQLFYIHAKPIFQPKTYIYVAASSAYEIIMETAYFLQLGTQNWQRITLIGNMPLNQNPSLS